MTMRPFCAAAFLLAALTHPAARAAPDAAPVMVRVVDADGGAPLTQFTYSWWTEAPGQASERPHEGVATNGEFAAPAAARCELNVRIEGPDLLGGYGRNQATFLVTEQARAFTFKAVRGRRVRGRVLAADSGEPVAGAEVRPMVFMPPLFVPDRDRVAATGPDGRFDLAGVDPGLGIGVAHPEFADWESAFAFKATTNADGSLETEVKLQRGAVAEGVVVDRAGHPLGGVEVESDHGKRATTDAAGAFRLAGLAIGRDARSSDATITFRLPGHLDHRLEHFAPGRGALRIVLEPQPALAGRVLRSDGQPVRKFRVWAGPGEEPAPFQCRESRAGSDGRFEANLEERAATNWLGIAAPGFAPWYAALPPSAAGGITCRLAVGTTVRLALASNVVDRAKVRAQLRLHRQGPRPMFNEDDPSQQQLLATFQAAPDAEGGLRFDHVPPGRYRLTLRGPGITPVGQDINVGGAPLDLGVVAPRGTGGIVGRIHPSKAQPVDAAYARGEIYYAGVGLNPHDDDPPIAFTADADGRFRVDRVPAGEVRVTLPYMATADIIDSVARCARVVAGRTTEVVFFGPSGSRDLRIQLKLGDGTPAAVAAGTGAAVKPAVANVTDRKPMFLVELSPPEDQSGSWDGGDWQELSAAGTLVLHDVSPSAYRLRLYDWHGSIGLRRLLVETNIAVEAGAAALSIPLGAGCIAGALSGTGDAVSFVHVFAVPHTAPPGVRETWSDDAGRFCLRYLSPGTYRLRAHDHDGGWADLGEVDVGAGIARCAGQPMQKGGELRVDAEAAAGGTVVAIDPEGRLIEADRRSDGPGSVFRNLWPGRWTVARGEGRGALTNVLIEAGATVRVAGPSR